MMARSHDLRLLQVRKGKLELEISLLLPPQLSGKLRTLLHRRVLDRDEGSDTTTPARGIRLDVSEINFNANLIQPQQKLFES